MNFEHDDKNCPVESKQHTKLSNKNWSQAKTQNETTAKNNNHNEYYDEHYDAQDDYYGNDDDYYYHYYDNNDEAEAYTEPKAKPNQHRADSFDPFEFWTSNPTNNTTTAALTHEPTASHQAKTTKTKQQPHKETKPAKQSQKSPQATRQSAAASTAKTASQKQTNKPTVSCHKRFAVGNYAHFLNEEPAADYSNQKKQQQQQPANKLKHNQEMSQEEVRAERYQYNNEHKNSYENDENPDFERIASNVNSHGRQKWKNSTKQTQPSKSRIKI